MKRLTTTIYALSIVHACIAARLFVSSYAGNITTVDISAATSGFNLKAIALSNGCAPNPSWLEFDPATSTLYCTDEGFPTPTYASVSAFSVNDNGSLKSLSKVTTLNGGVSATVFGDGKALAIAH